MKKLVIVCVAAMLLGAGCFPRGPSGEDLGRPVLSLTFPDTTTAGSVETAVLTVENPGPGDMGSLVVAFSRLGTPDLPVPVVDVAARDEQGAVRDVEPQPTAVSPDGVIYTFDGLDVGDTVTIELELTMPRVDGLAGNAILVYDGGQPERARGVRLETEVGG